MSKKRLLVIFTLMNLANVMKIFIEFQKYYRLNKTKDTLVPSASNSFWLRGLRRIRDLGERG